MGLQGERSLDGTRIAGAPIARSGVLTDIPFIWCSRRRPRRSPSDRRPACVLCPAASSQQRHCRRSPGGSSRCCSRACGRATWPASRCWCTSGRPADRPGHPSCTAWRPQAGRLKCGHSCCVTTAWRWRPPASSAARAPIVAACALHSGAAPLEAFPRWAPAPSAVDVTGASWSSDAVMLLPCCCHFAGALQTPSYGLLAGSKTAHPTPPHQPAPPPPQDILLHILAAAAPTVPLLRRPRLPHGVEAGELPPGVLEARFRAQGEG